MMRCALMVVVPLVVAGCSGGIFRTFDADKASASVDAKQRVILSGVRKTPKGDERRIICAEPSPDAMVALAQAMSLEATVAGQGGGGISGSLAEAVTMIGKRTVTIQLLRDGLYRACEAYLNGAIDDYGYALLLGQFDRLMVSMLALEGLMQLEPAPPEALTGGGKEFRVSNASPRRLCEELRVRRLRDQDQGRGNRSSHHDGPTRDPEVSKG